MTMTTRPALKRGTTRRRLGIAGAVGAVATLGFAGTALAATIAKYKETQIVEPFRTSQLPGGQSAAMSADGSTLVLEGLSQ